MPNFGKSLIVLCSPSVGKEQKETEKQDRHVALLEINIKRAIIEQRHTCTYTIITLQQLKRLNITKDYKNVELQVNRSGGFLCNFKLKTTKYL